MRRRAAEKRSVLPDPKYNSRLVTKTINRIMLDGKKGKAQHIFYGALALVRKKTKLDPMEIFQTAVENITPELELKSRRIGGANYRIPIEVRNERKSVLALRWLIVHAKKRKERQMTERLAYEIISAKNRTGGAFKQKETTHKMAKANRAFAHYRW